MMANSCLRGLKLATLLVVAGLGYWGGWWDQLFHNAPPAHAILQPTDPELRSFRTKLDGWNDHQRTWEVTAEQIWQSANASLIYFEEVSRGLIFAMDGKSIVFKGDWARWEKRRNRLVLGGNLEVRFDDKRLTTAELQMECHTGKLIAPGEVVISGNDLVIKAGYMIMDLQTERVRLEQGVKWVQRGDRLQAKGLEVDFRNDRFELIEPEGLFLTL